jgi:hypothetical protein
MPWIKTGHIIRVLWDVISTSGERRSTLQHKIQEHYNLNIHQQENLKYNTEIKFNASKLNLPSSKQVFI